jgi:hypothetical protein
MARNSLGLLFAVFLAGSCGWVAAQQGQPADPPADHAVGRFVVTAVNETAVLVDSTSGKSWSLTEDVDGLAVWLPFAARFDDRDEAMKWKLRDEHERQALQEAERQRQQEPKLMP